MTHDELEFIRTVLSKNIRFKESFLSAANDKEQRMVIHDFIEAYLGSHGRKSSLLVERSDLAKYFTQQFNSANSGTNAAPTPTTKEIDMNQTLPAIETKTYIFGQLAANVTDDQVFSQVAALEAQIEQLDKTVNKSKKLAAKIEALHADIKALNDFVDARP